MLKKLRIKFMIVNMVIVTFMVGAIMAMLYISTSHNLERDSIQMLEKISLNPMHNVPQGESNGSVKMPYICVLTDKDGNIIEVISDIDGYSDEESVAILINGLDLSVDRMGDIGELDEGGFRYMITMTPDGKCCSLIDISAEKEILSNQLRFYAMNGGIAFIIFFIICFFLSKWAVKPVEKAWEQQKQFVADASHELKTPLTVIMTDAELIQSSGDSDGDVKVLAQNIKTMSEQMRGLVESMLELARIDNGNLKATKETVLLSEIVSNSAMIFEPVFFEKDMTFSYEIEDDIKVIGNGVQLKQVVENLLDNAGKYARTGGTASLKLQRLQHRRCILSVTNEGEQIEKDELKNLFKRFYRTDKVRKMNHSYGLGLSIVQSIVEEHKGRIWAESRGGQNSFYVELPLQS